MLISIESSKKDGYYVKSTIKICDESDIYEVINATARNIISYGFHQDNIIDGMKHYLEQQKNDNNCEDDT